jgi:site-specific recombinase XerD
LMLAQGVKEEDVKHLLGHASIATTRGYLGVARQLRLRMEGSLILGDLDG